MNKTNIQLICSDIDGTLLDKNRQLSKKTIAVLTQLGKNYPLLLISSRMPKSLRLLQNEINIINHPLIAYNGSLILDGDKTLLSQEIPFNVLEKLAAYVKGTSIHLSLYHNDEWLVPENDYWAKREENNTRVKPIVQDLYITLNDWQMRGISAHKVMCMGDADEIEQLYQTINKQHAHQINAYRSKDTYIELSHIEQDKASALSFLLEENYPSLTMKNCIAFGDNYNDTTLLQQVGAGIAVANAKKEVLECADGITQKNTEDGVANYLEKVFY